MASMDWDSSKDYPLLRKVLQEEWDDSQECDFTMGDEPTVPSVVTPPTSPVHHGSIEDDDSFRNQDEPAPSDPSIPSLEDPPVAVVLTALRTTKKHPNMVLAVGKKPKSSNNRKPEKYPTKASKQTKKQTKTTKKDMSLKIRDLMKENGPQHVYLNRGAPFRKNLGNIRFRNIVDMHYGAYKLASKNADKTTIIMLIKNEVESDGSKFFVVKTKEDVSHEPAEDKKINAKMRRVLLDTPKRRADLWSWEDPANEQPSWTPFLNKDGEKLELMFRKDEDNRTKVDVTVREEKHRVDVSLRIIYRVDADGNITETNLRVRRLDPDEVMDQGTMDSFELWMSTLAIPDAPGAPMQNSDFNPVSSDQRLSPAAPAPMITMPGNGMPDVVRAKNLIKTNYEKKRNVKANAGLVCWSWADPADEQLYLTGDGEQLSWSDFSNEDGTALERMYQTSLLSRGAVDVTVREERHLVDVSLTRMYRAEPDVNNITYLHVRRCPPDEEMDGREPICVSGDSDGQYDDSSSAKSSGSQSSGTSGTSTRSCSQPTDGGGRGQSNLHWSLGMAQRSKDECSVFAFEASNEDVLEEITAALEEERWNDGRSTGLPGIATDVGTIGTIGARRPGLVKIKKMVESQIGLSIGNKKDPMEADPLSIGEKKAPTEKEEQNMEIPRHKETSIWPETKTRMSRHSIDVIVGAPPAVNDKKPTSLSSYDKALTASMNRARKPEVGKRPRTTLRFRRVLEEIKARWNDGRSTGLPGPIATDVWTIGVRRPGLVKIKKMVESQIGLSIGNKKDPMEADPLSIGKKKAPTEKAEQNLEIPRQKAIWLWRETITRMSRHSTEAIFGDPKDCWVRYDEESSASLEASYQAQNGIGECQANSKYTVDFGLMLQMNVSTRFPREVRRLEPTTFKHATKRSMVDTGRKLDPVKVHEADDMTAHTFTAETMSMGLDDTLTFYRHKKHQKNLGSIRVPKADDMDRPHN